MDMRTGRSNGSTTYAYVYSGSQLKKLTVGGNTLLIQYGTTGMPVGLTYNNTRYYYVTNLQGDVIAILNSSKAAVVTYTYDAWGNILTTTDTSGVGLASKNPLRYRGYVYDQETQLYYLQSRYYNPAMGRYICADGDVSTGQGILGYNMFAYCSNNPVVYKESSVSMGTSTTASLNSSGNSDTINNQIQSNASVNSSSSFNLFGYELRSSAGWIWSPYLLNNHLLRIGVSSYITHTEGQKGALYTYAGSTIDGMNFLGAEYYAGVGVNLYDILGAEIQVQAIGAAAQLNLGSLSISGSTNFIGETYVTIAWNTTLENGDVLTEGFTIGANTGSLLLLIIGAYTYFTTGDPNFLNQALS